MAPSSAETDSGAAPSDRAPANENRMLGIAFRLMSVFFLALMIASVKMAGREGVHIVECLFWRQLAGLPVVLIWLRMTGSIGDIRTTRPLGHAVRMIVGLSGMAINFWAITLLPLAEATTIGFAVPIFSTVLAAVLLGEKTGGWRWSAVLIGFAGILIVMQPGAAIAGKGAAVALCGAFATASVTIIIRQLGKTETTGAIVFWFSLTSLLPLGILLPFVAQGHSAEAWGYVALLGVAGAAGQICVTSSLRYAPVAVALPMDYVSLLWATFYGWLLFDALPAPTTWIGAPVIIGAGLIIVWREQRRQRASAAFADQPVAPPPRE